MMALSPNEELPKDWSRYRAYLRLLATSGMPEHLKQKLDPSDVVQQTLLHAVRSVQTFSGNDEAQVLAWLKQILVNNLAKTVRDFSREKRDVRRERQIEAAIHSSTLKLESILIDAQPDPQDRAVKTEALVKLSNAIESLPEAQAEAIRLHHIESLPVSQVAEQMERSVTAVAGLMKRGFKTLRETVPVDRN